MIAKAFQSDKTMVVKSLNEEKEKQINDEKSNLMKWLEKAKADISNIESTINYLKSKDVPLISNPLVENPMGEEVRLKTIEFLRA